MCELDNAILPTVVHFLGAWMFSDSKLNKRQLVKKIYVFFFCILKVFLDGPEQNKILAWKTCKNQEVLSLRYSGHPEIVKQ